LTRFLFPINLSSFDFDLQKLAQIPILPPLVQGAEDQPFHAFDDVYNDNGESFVNHLAKQQELTSKSGGELEKPPSETSIDSTTNKSSSGGEQSSGSGVVAAGDDSQEMKDSNNQKSTGLSLLQWISSNENQKTLKRMAENCTRELEVFDKNVMDTFKEDIEKTVETAKREDIKEIKGLGERLQGLEALKRDAKKLVAEQNDIAQALVMNQTSASRAGDASILPDLCAPHASQLAQMLKNHKKLRDIGIKCGKAKDELCKNILQRLKFVIHIENKMYEIDCKLLFYHRCLRRLQKHLGIIEQIHQAPCVYVQAVTEVVRRRIFSTAFLTVSKYAL
jgi:RB1-inducible coiled-coil protein 1